MESKEDAIEVRSENITDYPNFNAFFTRKLKSSARPFSTNPNTIISPIDGYVSQVGALAQDSLLQAKGQHYSLTALLTSHLNDYQAIFNNGNFATLYLSPADYHRIHMPITGTLRKMVYVPGKLFSVNPLAAIEITDLYSRNERVIAIFDTATRKQEILQVQ